MPVCVFLALTCAALHASCSP
uniref:Uncharacterized protein n=1 Tax=Arundo donax TaxID=35708 RepID=A0A0A9HVS3_ARUDO